MNLCFFLKDMQEIDTNLFLTHQLPHCYNSHVYVKGILFYNSWLERMQPSFAGGSTEDGEVYKQSRTYRPNSRVCKNGESVWVRSASGGW